MGQARSAMRCSPRFFAFASGILATEAFKLLDFATDVQVAVIFHRRHRSFFPACIIFLVLPAFVKVLVVVGGWHYGDLSWKECLGISLLVTLQLDGVFYAVLEIHRQRSCANPALTATEEDVAGHGHRLLFIRLVEGAAEALPQVVLQSLALFLDGLSDIEPIQMASAFVSAASVGTAFWILLATIRPALHSASVLDRVIIRIFWIVDTCLRVFTIAVFLGPAFQPWSSLYFGLLVVLLLPWAIARVGSRANGAYGAVNIAWMTLLSLMLPMALGIDSLDSSNETVMNQIRGWCAFDRMRRLLRYVAVYRHVELFVLVLVPPFFDDTAAELAPCALSLWLLSSLLGLRTLRVLGLWDIWFGRPIEPSAHASEPLPNLLGSPAAVPLSEVEAAVWNEKVHELAGRGFELGHLLDFVGQLGGALMPHFDPARSTTSDVVRGAIIPGSWQGTGTTAQRALRHAFVQQASQSASWPASRTEPHHRENRQEPDVVGCETWSSSWDPVCPSWPQSAECCRRACAECICLQAERSLPDEYPVAGGDWPGEQQTDLPTPALLALAVESLPEARHHGFLPTMVGLAYAEVLHDCRRVLPSRMVSHSWGGLFMHLVAAIVADALDVPMYGSLVPRLSRGNLPELKAELASKGMLSLTYWVCAFSVNQHTSICAGFGAEPAPGTAECEEFDRKRRDSVTAEVYPTCSCPTEKVPNSRPGCEVNKFDAMMGCLARGPQGFRQVVVVDPQFEVFTRAWVVAELIAADSLGMPQRLKMQSARCLEAFRREVGEVRIEACAATRKEDKEEILAKVSDIEEFNARLNAIIFGERTGLLASFAKELSKIEAPMTAEFMSNVSQLASTVF